MKRVPLRRPTSRDLARLVLARASSRLSLQTAGDRFSDAIVEVFRREIGAAVRCASPLIPVVLEREGRSLDELAWLIQPATGWPDRPRLPATRPVPAGTGVGGAGGRSPVVRGGRTEVPAPTDCHCLELGGSGGERLVFHVVDHSLELAAWSGGIRLRSLFGVVRVVVPADPGSPSGGPRPGDRLHEAVAHPALRGADWPIAAVETIAGTTNLVLSVRTGTLAYSLPWSR